MDHVAQAKEGFEENFAEQYGQIHRLETNKLRNVARFYAHLLYTDALQWTLLGYIRLTEEDTTSSSRIFIKIMLQVRATAALNRTRRRHMYQ